jgi:hypothetical protein
VLAAAVTAVALWSGVAGAATSTSADSTNSVPAALVSDSPDTAAPATGVVSDPVIDPAATATSVDTAPEPALLWNGLSDSVKKPSLATLLRPIFGNRWTAVFGSVAGNRWGGAGW